MRGLADADRLRRFLRELAREAEADAAVYLTGGATAVLLGWRERSLPIERVGRVSFYHYDPYSQALAKIERGHAKDLADVAQLLDRGLVEPPRLRELFETIEPRLHRYPAVDPRSFRKRLDDVLRPRT